MSFRLYSTERHWCSFADYGAILSTVERLKAKRVLEFGPGSSTLALIEGGAQHIDACEDNPHWAHVARERFDSYTAVMVHEYRWAEPLTITTVDDQWYDLGVIDGPKVTESRPIAIAYALERCANVLVALEEEGGSKILRQAAMQLALDAGRDIEITHTGPLAGSYALIGPCSP